MADQDDVKEGKDFGLGRPADTQGFYLKGCANYDWGMKNRMSRIFNPKTGRTVMLAFDHGYFQGPATGLERIDLNILPLPPSITKPVALRCSGGQSILTEISNETVAVDIEDAMRLGACAMAAQVYIGAEYEHNSIANVIKLIDTGMRYGIPTLAVTGVGKDMARDARYFGLASRIAAELGAQYVKTYYTDTGFERVVAGCPVPIVIAGGKKLPELEALKMAYKAVDQGAAGVDMGRNIFQADAPVAMIKAVAKVVHELERPEKALQFYNDLKAEKR